MDKKDKKHPEKAFFNNLSLQKDVLEQSGHDIFKTSNEKPNANKKDTEKFWLIKVALLLIDGYVIHYITFAYLLHKICDKKS